MLSIVNGCCIDTVHALQHTLLGVCGEVGCTILLHSTKLQNTTVRDWGFLRPFLGLSSAALMGHFALSDTKHRLHGYRHRMEQCWGSDEQENKQICCPTKIWVGAKLVDSGRTFAQVIDEGNAVDRSSEM
jgi:hypothetical protein